MGGECLLWKNWKIPNKKKIEALKMKKKKEIIDDMERMLIDAEKSY